MQPATKEDLRKLKTDLVKLMDVKFEAVSAKFETVSAKFETVATKEELVILESRMFKWGLSLVISNVSIAIAISFAAQKLLITLGSSTITPPSYLNSGQSGQSI